MVEPLIGRWVKTGKDESLMKRSINCTKRAEWSSFPLQKECQKKRYPQAPFYLFFFFFGVGKSWTSPGIKNYFCQPIPFLEPKSSKSGKECNVLSAHVPCCLFVMVSFNQKDLYGKGQVYDRAQKRSVLSSFSGDLNLPQTLLCKNRMTFPFSPWFQSCFRSATDQPLD